MVQYEVKYQGYIRYHRALTLLIGKDLPAALSGCYAQR